MNKNQTSSIEEEAIATISGQTSYSSIEYNQQCNVILPPQAEKLCIDLQDVNQIIQICNEAKRKTFPWGELLLALSMLCLGGEFGSWVGKLAFFVFWLAGSLFNFRSCILSRILFYP